MPKTKLTLARFAGTVRGMMATRPIGAGEALVCVPDRLLVTASKVRQAVLARAGAGAAWRLSEHQALAYWLCAESAAAPGVSAWSRYVETIPGDFESVPLCALSGASPSDAPSAATPAAQWIAAHLPPSVERRVAEQQARLFGDWAHTRAALAAIGVAPPADWRRYVWAWLAVNTRCIHLGRAPAGHDTMALAPVLDMLNHSTSASVSTHFDAARRQFVIRTHRAYRKGEEVFISYGPHDNGFLLAEYGFVAASNPRLVLDLSCEVEACAAAARRGPPPCPRAHRRRPRAAGDAAAANAAAADALVALLRRHGLWGEFALTPDDAEPPYRVQAALRLLLAAQRLSGPELRDAVARWERWRCGEPVDSDDDDDCADVTQWIQRACARIAARAQQMALDAQDPPAPVGRFLARCLGAVWLEISQIALRWRVAEDPGQ
ncbi:hypothetical protein H4R18_002258 [Coemansia javaensis]|uniref:SET domain-containing protein n=1 Tax=Coemansia javaensis TaxID=2761396 RepID=A0A9W8LHZ0_9FUNG|nr:hypothetical protein H4R18_002258 [Coemansia javaensis]